MQRNDQRQMMLPYQLQRFALALIMIAGAIGFASCSPEDPFIPTSQRNLNIRNGAFLRVVHASADAPAVRVKIDTTMLFDGTLQSYLLFSKTNAARYYPVDSAASQISFLDAGGGALASGPLSFSKGAFYTAYLYGNAGDYHVLVTTDTVYPPARSNPLTTSYRIVHLSTEAPPITVRLGSLDTEPVVTNLAYGSASSYVHATEVIGTTIFMSDANTQKVIFISPGNLVTLIPYNTWTLLITGSARPTGNQAFLQLSAFNESAFDASDSLYGFSPLQFVTAAMRFVSLVPSPHDSTELDVTLYDSDPEFAANDGYRRTLYTGNPGIMDVMYTLGKPGQPIMRPYLQSGYRVDSTIKWRVEYHQPLNPPQPGKDGKIHRDYRRQDVLVGTHTFIFNRNRRYTLVAFGPHTTPAMPALAEGTTLLDNTPLPPSGMAQVRFFHGAFGDSLELRRLKIRVNGAANATQPIAYGEATSGSNSFAAPVGAVSVEVVDAAGVIYYSQELTDSPLMAGNAYTIFLHRGFLGDRFRLVAVSEELRQQ